mgnify:CR=1 FL=1
MPALIQRSSQDAYGIVVEAELVAMALQLASGKWALFDLDDRRMSKTSFATPKEVAAHFDELLSRIP